MNRDLTIGSVSDIHLGHKRNEASFIIANLNRSITNDAVMSTLDVLNVAGDVFDDLISLNDEDVPHIKAWIARLLHLAVKYDVSVWVLEGTPSHDRGQSHLFTSANEIRLNNGQVPADLLYVRELSIQHIEKFDINVLFVPDEWRHSTQETLEEVQGLLLAHGLTQVDISVMHGMFTYQAPAAAIKNMPLHSEEAYLAITKYLIFIGHVHLYSQYDRIIAQGSFDRISHGEEGPKGFVLATLYKDGDYASEFVENTTARRFVTISCASYDVEQCFQHIDYTVRNLPDASLVRLSAMFGNPILSNLDVLKARYPTLIWTPVKVETVEVEESATLISAESRYIPINIDSHNVRDLVMNRLDRLDLRSDVLSVCANIMADMQQL